VAVITGADIGDDLGGLICGWLIHSKDGSPMKAGGHPVLATDKVRYVGDHVALIVAESLAQARDAETLLDVDYKILEANVDPARAEDKATSQIHDVAENNVIYDWALGDEAETGKAFDKADQVISLDVVNNRMVPNAVEPRAALASYDAASGSYKLYNTTQNPHVARLVLSAFVGVAPEHKLRVISPDVGGGFGSKIFIYPEETAILYAAGKLGRPVKWTASRSHAFLTDAHGRDHVTNAELALDKDGGILALRVKTIAGLGAYMSTFSSSVPTYLYATLLSGQYNIPAIYAEVKTVYTNTAPVDAVRGAGRPEACYVIERLMDKAARARDEDPADLRARNFITEFPHQTPVIMAYDAGDYHACLNDAKKAIDYAGFAKRKQASEKAGRLRGIGISSYIEACGIAPSAAVGSLGAGVGLWESAEVRVNPTGNVAVLTGCQAQGQGHETTFAQVVADKLGIGLDDVDVIHGDTETVQFGMGTYGSRSGPVGLSAAASAADKVIEKAHAIAAHQLEADADDVTFADGTFTARSSNKTMAFGEVALAAYLAHNLPEGMEPGLKETSFYDPTNFTFPAGSHICEVEVDPDTGRVEIANYVAVDDFGTVINPNIVEGQVHGGVAFGIGQALLENARYDPDSGQLVTGSYLDYALPRADDMPSLELGFVETKCPSNLLGVKGCGEAGAIAAPACVMNALTNALGIDDLPMPATPERVWRAAQANRPAAE
jgi:carbon-monoxide dehydrogenase large subunit